MSRGPGSASTPGWGGWAAQPAWLPVLADEIATVGDVVGVTLGGSRARGDETPGSDVDLGVYHRGDVDVVSLNALARRWSSTPVEIGPPGSWGPWVDRGGWLTVAGMPVDWILRDLDRVDEAWDLAAQGQSRFHPQPGHPFGFWDASYVGELLTGRVLVDPTGELRRYQERWGYPDALVDQAVARLWEAEFDLAAARKGRARGDAVFVQLCVAHALMVCAHALHAQDRVWVLNEKGLVPGVRRLPSASAWFADEAEALLGAGAGVTPGAMEAVMERADALVRRVQDFLAR